MSSRRKLKKDVNNLCYEVINECFSFLDHSPSLNQENVQVIISDAVELRNQLISKINHPEHEGSSPRSVTAYYRQIKEELYENTITLIERLNSLPR